MTCYTHELCKIAQTLGQQVQIQYADKTFRYIVSIPNVVYKELHIRKSIEGYGFTIEDSCNDFIRKCKGQQLENYITNVVMLIR